MPRKTCCWLFVVLLAVCASLALSVQAANKKATYTTIVVNDMHCPACAQKIAARLYAVPGVLEVRADVPADTVYVIPQRSRQPSPRAMWVAVEQAGFKPLKLIGPAGQFTSKPSR